MEPQGERRRRSLKTPAAVPRAVSPGSLDLPSAARHAAPNKDETVNIDYQKIGSRLYSVEPVGKKFADEWIRRRHYSGSAVWSSHTHLVVVDSFGFEWGVLQFGPAMNPKATRKVIHGLEPRGLVELNRMAFVDGHDKNLVSWAIRQAMRHVRRCRPEAQVVQSFADQRCRLMGVVYQAANFIYLGSHETAFYFLDGEWFHKSLVGRAEKDKRGWGRGPKAERLANGFSRATKHTFRQFRYAFPLTAWARRQLRGRSMPYPKPCDYPGIQFPSSARAQDDETFGDLPLFSECGS